jgi:protein-tyrosine phosphatase
VHPEFLTGVSVIPDAVRELREALEREHIRLEVHAGGELAPPMVGRLNQEELELLAHGPPGRRWLLLEPPFAGMDEHYTAAADELRERGFAVLVAHPERAEGELTEAVDAAAPAIEHELRAGSALQLTACSFLGEFGVHTRAIALRLLRSSPRVVLASDAHGPRRLPGLRAAVRALAAEGVPAPARLAGAIPQAMLERGLAIPPAALVA